MKKKDIQNSIKHSRNNMTCVNVFRLMKRMGVWLFSKRTSKHIMKIGIVVAAVFYVSAVASAVRAQGLGEQIREWFADKAGFVYSRDESSQFIFTKTTPNYIAYAGDRATDGGHTVKLVLGKHSLTTSFISANVEYPMSLATQSGGIASASADLSQLPDGIKQRLEAVQKQIADLDASDLTREVQELTNQAASILSKAQLREDSTERTVLFDDIILGTNIQYRLNEGGIKQEIVIASPDELQNHYILSLLSEGLTYRDMGAGVWYFFDNDNDAVMRLPKVYARDEAKAFTNDVNVVIAGSGESQTMHVTVPYEWLTDPARVYPVTIHTALEVVPGKRAGHEPTAVNVVQDAVGSFVESVESLLNRVTPVPTSSPQEYVQPATPSATLAPDEPEASVSAVTVNSASGPPMEQTSTRVFANTQPFQIWFGVLVAICLFAIVVLSLIIKRIFSALATIDVTIRFTVGIPDRNYIADEWDGYSQAFSHIPSFMARTARRAVSAQFQHHIRSVLAVILIFSTVFLSIAPQVIASYDVSASPSMQQSITVGSSGTVQDEGLALVTSDNVALDHAAVFSDSIVTRNTLRTILSLSKQNYAIGEVPVITLSERFVGLQQGVRMLVDWFGGSSTVFEQTVKITLTDHAGQEVVVDVDADATGNLTIVPEEPTAPGTYTLTISDGIQTISQDFTWGVLAINTNKSMYLPGQTVEFSFGVLDDRGNVLCNADLSMVVTAPDGSTIQYSGKNDLVDPDLTTPIIANSPDCYVKNFTLIPDYRARYSDTNTVGTYTVNLTASTPNGTYSLSDRFEVRESVAFDIERLISTRIYPYHPYPAVIHIAVNQDYQGTVQEIVPAGFDIRIPTSKELTEDYSLNVDLVGNQATPSSLIRTDDTQLLQWQVDWKKGNSYDLAYIYDAPDVSPEFYQIGPMVVGTFTEIRNWQIASDASGDIILLWDGAGDDPPTTGGTSWDCISCDGADPYFNVYPRGAADYGISTAGSAQHNHTVTGLVSQGITSSSTPADDGSGADMPSSTHTHNSISGSSVSNADNNPSHRILKVVRSSGTPTTLPSGIIGMFDTTTMPTNWDLYTSQNTYLLRGGATIGAAGSDTHQHTTVTTNMSSAYTGTVAVNLGGSKTGSGPATAGHAHACTGATDSNKDLKPPYKEVVFAKANTDVSIPSGLIAMFDNTSLPSYWTRISGSSEALNGYFIRGNTAGYGGTGGAETHTQHANATLSCAATSDTQLYDNSPANAGADLNHTHTATVSFSSSDSVLPVYRDTIFAKRDNMITVSGYIKGADESTTDTTENGTVVKIVVEGGSTYSPTLNSSGYYTQTIPTPTSGNAILVYVDDAGDYEGSCVTVSGGSDISLDLYEDRLIMRSDKTATSLVLQDLVDVDTGDADDLISSVTTGALTVASDKELHLYTGDTFAPGGNVTTQGTGGLHLDDSATFTGGTTQDHVITGNVDIDAGATLTAPSTEDNGTIKVGGNWTNNSTGVFTAGSGKVIFTATSGTKTIDPQSDAFYDLTLGESSGTATWNLSSALDITGDLTIAYGTLGMNGSNNISTVGTVAISSGGAFSESTGTWTFKPSGTKTLTDSSSAGPQDLGIVSISSGTSTPQITLGSSIKVSKLTLASSHTLALGSSSYTLEIAGDGATATVFSNSGTLSPGTSTVKYSAVNSGGNVDVATAPYNNLEVSGADTYVLTGNLTSTNHLTGNLTIGASATLDTVSAYNLEVQGNWVNSGTFTARSSTVTLDAISGSPEISSDGDSFYNLSIDNGGTSISWTMIDALDVNRNLLIDTNNTLDAQGFQVNIAGDLTVNGTYTANSNTTILDGAADTEQIVDGGITFYNLTATTGDRIIRFGSGDTVVIGSGGTFTATGDSCDALIMIRSTTAGSVVNITKTGSVSLSYIDIQDINFSAVASATNSVDSGNNTNITIAANVCEGASTNASATGYSFQRKTFYDSVNLRYWLFFHDGDQIEVRYSSDGSTWSVDDDHLAYDTNDFSVWWQVVGGNEYVWLAVADSNDIKVRQGALSDSGVAWDSDVATALNDADGRCSTYDYPYISLDVPSSGNPHIWVTARCTDGANYSIEAVDTSTTAEADPSTWAFNTPSEISTTQADEDTYASIAPLSGGDMYATFASGTALEGCRWDDDHESTGRWETADGTNACTATEGGGGDESTYFDSLSTDLAGYWKMNEASWNGTADEVVDSSGNGYHGTRQGSANTASAGFNRSGNFSATTSDYATRSVSNFLSSSYMGTVNFWYKPDNFSANSYLFASADEASSNKIMGYSVNSSAQLYVAQQNADTLDYLYVNETLSANNWYMLTLMSNGSSYSAYINGVKKDLTIGSGSNTGDWFGDTPLRDNISIGALKWNSTSGYYARGMLDEMRVYTRVLTDEEVAKLYQYKPEKVNIDDASDFDDPIGASRQVARTSSGVLYSFLNDAGSCELWKSTDGVTWTEQDSANNPTCVSGSPVALAIDSSNNPHVAYVVLNGSNHEVWWNTVGGDTFDTAGELGTSDTYTSITQLDMSIDANSIPHVVCADSATNTTIYYNNRIGAAWNTTGISIEAVSGATSVNSLSITIDEDNIPLVAYINSADNDLSAVTGNQNDASSFGTPYDVDDDVNDVAGERGASIAVDTLTGDTWIAYVREDSSTDDITLAKRADGSETSSWSTGWTIDLTNSSVGYEPSIAVTGSSDVYVFYENDTDDISYDVYDGSAWAGETVLQTGTFQDVKVKGGFEWNNYAPNKIDYIFSDDTDVFFDSLRLTRSPTNIDNASDFEDVSSSGRQVVRTSSGVLYVVMDDPGYTEVWKSVDNGNTWIQQDTADSPTSNATINMLAVEIDSTDKLHILYTIGSGPPPNNDLRYITFTTSDDQFGNIEDVNTPTSTYQGISITIDNNDVPHFVIAEYDGMGSEGGLHYNNRVDGSWIGTAVEIQDIDDSIWGSSITISDEDIPEVSYIAPIGGNYKLVAAIGDDNDPDTAGQWTKHDVDTNVVNTVGISAATIGIDSSGNTWIVYVDENGVNDYITLYKHDDGQSWDNSDYWHQFTDSKVGYEPSLAIDGTSVYVLHEDDQDNIVYDKYNGSAWSGETTLEEHGALQDVKARWSYINNYDSTGTAAVQINTAYLDGSDEAASGAVWSYITNMDDGNIMNFASTTTNGSTSSNFASVGGTNITTSTSGAIDTVKIRFYGWIDRTTPADTELISVTAYTDSWGESLGTVTDLSDTAVWSDYATLSAPSGGWTWQKINDLQIKVYASGLDDDTAYVAKIEIRVDGDNTDSQTEIDYVYSDGTDVFYNRMLLSGTTPGTQDAIDTLTGNLNDNFSLVSNGSDTLHLVFVDDESTDQVSYKKFSSGSWGSAVLVSGGADDDDAYVTLTLNTTDSKLYAFWTDTTDSDVFYSFCSISTGCDAASEWAAESGEETQWVSTGTNASATSNYSGVNKVLVEWTVGSATPFSVNWSAITFGGNSAPSAPTFLYVNESDTGASSGVSNPVNVGDGTPVFSAQNNDVDEGDVANKFQIIVYSDASCTVTVWNSGDSGTSMTSCTEGNQCSDIDYGTTALVFDGATYYWKIKYWDDSGDAGSFSDCSDTFTMLAFTDQMRHGKYYFNRTTKRIFSW